MLLISSILLFLANAFTIVEAYNSGFSVVAEKLSTISFYGVFVLGFLAFNGEGIAYKHSRETKKKKITTCFKMLVLFAFVVRYVKSFVEKFVLSFELDDTVGLVGRVFMSVLNTVSSYGFLLTMVALWYIIRESSHKKLLPVGTLAFISGLLYNSYKIFNYMVSKYNIDVLGDLFSQVFSQKSALNALCLVHFGMDIILFVAVLLFYDKKAVAEQSENELIKKNTITARKIYSTDCYGIDTIEDDLFMTADKNDE